MIRIIGLSTALLVLGFSTGFSQQADYSDFHEKYDLDYRQFKVAFLPGFSTNGLNSTSFANKYSFNIIGGYNGGLDAGFELGGLFNANRYYAHGGQIAGLGNLTGGSMAGVQFGGLFNYARDDVQGVQFGGALNYAADDMQGIQFAGAANVSKGELSGLQFTGGVNWSGGPISGIQTAGIANIAGGGTSGLQFSGVATVARGNVEGIVASGAATYAHGSIQGIVASGVVTVARGDIQGIIASGLLNYSKTVQGITLAPLNISNDVQGIQFGTLNYAGQIQGIQFGVINYGRHMDGVPVGLLSYYGNGRKNMDFWTSDGGFLNYGLKLGTDEVYNMLSVGYNPSLGRDVWQLGWSIGRLHEYETHTLYTDFSVFRINEGGWTESNSLFKYRLLFGKELAKGLRVYGGPTFNVLASNRPESSNYTWYRLFDFELADRDFISWIGYSVGVELF